MVFFMAHWMHNRVIDDLSLPVKTLCNDHKQVASHLRFRVHDLTSIEVQ